MAWRYKICFNDSGMMMKLKFVKGGEDEDAKDNILYGIRVLMGVMRPYR